MSSYAVDLAKSEPPSPAASSSAAAKQSKKSQRPSWSCTECTGRKIRCDRVVPGCNQCIKRNKVHLCRLDQDEKSGFGPDGVEPTTQEPVGEPRFATAAEFEAINRNVSLVRQRLFHLERVVGAFVSRPDMLDATGQPTWAVDMSLLHHGSSSATDGYPSPVPPSMNAIDNSVTHQTAYSGNHHYTPVTGTKPMYPIPVPHQPAPLAPDHEDESHPPHPLYSRHSSGLTEDDGEVEAAVTLEYLALGRDGKSAHVSRAELRRPTTEDETPPEQVATTHVEGANLHHKAITGASGPVHRHPLAMLDELAQPPLTAASAMPSSPASILPPQPTANAIISYSLERVGWQHGAVHIGQFRAECAEFDSWGPSRADKVNQAWLALYFAVLCVGVKHMSSDDARACGLTNEDQRVLPKLFFDASVESLHRGQFLAKHSIFAVQTIVILVISCQDVGGSDLIATLLACGIRIAQHLKISRFGSDEEWDRKRRQEGIEPQSEIGIKGLIQREVRKRLWYALATEDWLSVPFRRAYAVFPSHFTTPPPRNCHDEDLSSGLMVNRPQDEPTCVSKILIAHKVASCIRRFFEDVNSRPDRELSYELLLEVDREIRGIINDGPVFLRNGDGDDRHPPWVRWMLHWWIMSVSHKLLMCHRVFLGRSFRDPKYAYSRKAAIEAARSIIQELVKGTHLPYQHLWTVPYHTISAATTIILDIFQTPSSDPDLVHKRNEVQAALDELRLLSEEGHSQIAARGIQLLSTLLAEEARHRRPVDSRKRKAAHLAGGDHDGAEAAVTSGQHGGGQKHASRSSGDSPAKRVMSDSRTSLSGPPPHQNALPTPELQPQAHQQQHQQHRPHAPPPHRPRSALPAAGSNTFPYFAPTLSTGPPAASPGVGSLPNTSPAGDASYDPTSPHDSYVSDTSLSQDAFESILQNLGAGWPAGGETAGFVVDGGSYGPSAHLGYIGGRGATGAGGPPGWVGGRDHTGDFYRMLDAGSFDFATAGGGAYHGGHETASTGGQAATPGQPHSMW